MQSIISLDGKCRTKEVKNVVAMFTQGSWDSQRIDLMASELGTVERHRKFSASGFVSTALAFVGKTAAHQTTYHLEACREQYQQAFNVSISNKCFHNQVRKDTILDLAIECCNQAISAVHRKTQCYQQQLVAKDQRSLLKRIGCLDLIAVDGCERTVRESCRDNFDCKGSGRHKKSGLPAKPALKVHLAFSLTQMRILSFDITEGVADERQHTFMQEMKDCCFIGDRGYFSTELESRLIEQHSQFIIKGRSNMVSGTIVEAYGDGGTALPEYIGMKYRDIKSRTDQCLDVVLKTSTGHLVRVVRKVNPHPDSNRDLQATDMDKADERYVYLRTSIGRELLNAEQLSQLYRLRWMV